MSVCLLRTSGLSREQED